MTAITHPIRVASIFRGTPDPRVIIAIDRGYVVLDGIYARNWERYSCDDLAEDNEVFEDYEDALAYAEEE